MLKKLLIAAGLSLLFSPLLFSDMLSGDGMGMGSQQMKGRRQVSISKQGKSQEFDLRVSTDSVADILLFQDKLPLTGQQVISMQMIDADAQQEAAERSIAVEQCRKEYLKSINQGMPDFPYIRAMLKKMTDAQADVQAVWVDAYQKAYMLLTDAQKTRLEFLRAARQQAIDKKAEEAAQASSSSPSTLNR